jgi:ferredoxin--NADP+ reductase
MYKLYMLMVFMDTRFHASPLSVSSVPASPQRWLDTAILHVRSWALRLWSVRVACPAGFRYQPGHYARLGLADEVGNTLWRPYSMVSAPAETVLEFLVTLIPSGALTPRFASLCEGDTLRLAPEAYGFFLAESLAPAEALWMLATGSGVGPYLSMLREGSVFRRFARIALVHSVRTPDELAYAGELQALATREPLRFRYQPVLTRSHALGALGVRIPQLLVSGELARHCGMPDDSRHSRFMVCGNPAFTTEMRALLALRGFEACRRGVPGSMLFEKYW